MCEASYHAMFMNLLLTQAIFNLTEKLFNPFKFNVDLFFCWQPFKARIVGLHAWLNKKNLLYLDETSSCELESSAELYCIWLENSKNNEVVRITSVCVCARKRDL